MIQVIDYGAGNLRSITAALKRLSVPYRIVSNGKAFHGEWAIILPGVGAAGHAMRQLDTAGLTTCIRSATAPVLGICLGMQLLADISEEGGVATLGCLKGRTRRLSNVPKIPHMGWNRVMLRQPDTLFADIGDGEFFYFAHSYYADVASEIVTAVSDYGGHIPVAVQSGMYWGVQFHPEKSGAVGAQVLRNFCRLAEKPCK